MSKSAAGKGDTPRPCLVSNEELDLRWDYALGKLNISEEEMIEKIKEIRKKHKVKR
ncbi:MAG: hypothetical protein ACTSUO_08395 [Candidatus Thorarchaeota archaeon]